MLTRAGRLARLSGPLGVVLVWAIAVLPNLSVRSFIWEEGNNAELARDVLARGAWLEPAIFGLRTAEKPSLLSWLIAMVARLTGGVDEWSARLPSMLAVLVTALLVHRLTRRHAGPSASLFAAAAFMFCPLLLRKLTIGEPDTLVTCLSFAALSVWWEGEVSGRVTAWRWFACGALLTMVALAKGPQPIAFFALGVGATLLIRRRFSALTGLALCLALPAAATLAWATTVYRAGDFPVWLEYMRLGGHVEPVVYWGERLRFVGLLPIDVLPAALLLPLAVRSWWPGFRGGADRSPVVLPLVLYAGLCTLVLAVWPDTKTRYAMPIAPAVAVLAGMTIEPLWRRRHWAGAAAAAMAALLFVYQAVLVTVALPLLAEEFGATRRSGAILDAAVRAEPAPVFTLGAPLSNELFYVSQRIRGLDSPDATFPAPAWLLAPRIEVEGLLTRRPDLVVRGVLATSARSGLVAARVESRPRGSGGP